MTLGTLTPCLQRVLHDRGLGDIPPEGLRRAFPVLPPRPPACREVASRLPWEQENEGSNPSRLTHNMGTSPNGKAAASKPAIDEVRFLKSSPSIPNWCSGAACKAVAIGHAEFDSLRRHRDLPI